MMKDILKKISVIIQKYLNNITTFIIISLFILSITYIPNFTEEKITLPLYQVILLIILIITRIDIPKFIIKIKHFGEEEYKK